MSNNSKVLQIHDLLPKHLNSKGNTNWKALVEALGQSDQSVADLIVEVRKQFFVKTASRPYLDRLGSNHRISRPRFVGMDDTSFREYIPVLSYQPKQVKLIIDKLLDIFFFKESTTAFTTSQFAAPFNLSNGWELELLVDEIHNDRITFKSNEFTDINAAKAEEVVSAINRQSKYFYATPYYDSVSQSTFIRIFTNTVGSKGSLRVLGGRANAALRFNGFISNAGNGTDTEWTITKIGEDVVFQNSGGTSPSLNQLKTGDILISNLPGNSGSFKILNVDLINNSLSVKNLFATPGVFTQTSADDVKFIEDKKHVAYLNPRRAMTWETSPGQITIEMPTSPPVVKRSLKGSLHVNGKVSQMVARTSNNSLILEDGFQFPESGSFYIERMDEIISKIVTPSGTEISSKKRNSKIESNLVKYSYSSRLALQTTGDIVEGSNQIINLASIIGLQTGQQIIMDGVPPYSKVVSIVGNIVNMSFPATKTEVGSQVKFLGNELSGIIPELPESAGLNEYSLLSLTRFNNLVTATTNSTHNFKIGDYVIIEDTTSVASSWNGSFLITSVSSNSFTYSQIDLNDTASTLGVARVERYGLSSSGSKIILTTAISEEVSRMKGTYVWDTAAPFVLSSQTAKTTQEIKLGKIVKILNIDPNNDLPKEGGNIIFNYGRANQEGPVKYLYKPTNDAIVVDPSYTFKKNHSIGSPIVKVGKSGPHVMSGKANEYAPYITDPSEARFILQELIKSVKSAGIFVDFLIRFPDQLYGVLDVYNQQGLGAGKPFKD
jgi:hypothetical protein